MRVAVHGDSLAFYVLLSNCTSTWPNLLKLATAAHHHNGAEPMCAGIAPVNSEKDQIFDPHID